MMDTPPIQFIYLFIKRLHRDLYQELWCILFCKSIDGKTLLCYDINNNIVLDRCTSEYELMLTG